MSPFTLPAVTTAVLFAGLAVCTWRLLMLRRRLRSAHTETVRARHDAEHDPTTGLPNRRAVLQHLHTALAEHLPLGVVMLDLDSFKTVNDTLGHETGNDLLAAVAGRLAALPAPVVLAGRLSGDEFVLLVHADRDTVATVARTAWQTIAATPFEVAGNTLTVRASVGYALADFLTAPRMLLHHADAAMYAAKHTGAGVAEAPAGTWHQPPPGRRPRDQRRTPTP